MVSVPFSRALSWGMRVPSLTAEPYNRMKLLGATLIPGPRRVVPPPPHGPASMDRSPTSAASAAIAVADARPCKDLLARAL